jgi:hypothetical protein
LNGSLAGDGADGLGPPPRCTFAPLLYGFPALPDGLTLSWVLACGPSCFGSLDMLLLLLFALGYEPLDSVSTCH